MAATAFSYRSHRNSSDSDSDDSDRECIDWKRATKKTSEVESLEKIPIDPPAVDPAPPQAEKRNLKRKRNNIWSDVLEDQIISETLGHCGIKNKPKGYGSRGEESYDYTLGRKFQKEGSGSDEQMSDGGSSEKSSSNKRFKSNRFVELDKDGAAAARKIIRILGEQKHYLIYRVVKYLGIEKAMELLKMTETVEDSGGMMVKNQQRRRTPGGVYFQLLKSDKHIEQDTIDKIFEGELNSYEQKMLFLEGKKKKKQLKAEKKALLKKISEEFDQPVKPPVEESQMDEDSMIVEEPQEETNSNSNQLVPEVQNSKASDLEDGEIEE